MTNQDLLIQTVLQAKSTAACLGDKYVKQAKGGQDINCQIKKLTLLTKWIEILEIYNCQMYVNTGDNRIICLTEDVAMALVRKVITFITTGINDEEEGSSPIIFTDDNDYAPSNCIDRCVWGTITGQIGNQLDLQAVLNAKQDLLVSGINIKTINGISVLGSGDITIASSAAVWGSITGTLSSQTDLQTALGLKLDIASFTDTAVTSKLLTGYVSGGGAVLATDTILQAIQKLNGNISTGYLPYTGAAFNVNLGTYSLTTPNVIGGASVGSTLTLQGTSGIGTSSVAAIQFAVGNNGGINKFAIYNNGAVSNFGVGTKTTNVFFGYDSGIATYTGDESAVFGNNSAKLMTGGNSNTIIGSVNGRALTTGGQNTVLGSDSLALNQTGTANIAIGVQAATASTVNANIAIGVQALRVATTSASNIAIGYQAALSLLTGNGFNIIIGNSSTTGITTGAYNTIIGSQISGLSTTLANNIILADGQGNIKYNWDGTNNQFNSALYVTNGTFRAYIRDLVSVPSYTGIYLNVSPNSTNYALANDGSNNTFLNGTGSVYVSLNGTNVMRHLATFSTYTPTVAASGAITPFTFTAPLNTGQTASTNIPSFLITTTGRQWANGAIALQEEVRITAPVYSHVSGSNTITTAGTLSVYAPTTSGGFTTITNPYAIISNGGILVTGTSLISGAATFSNTLSLTGTGTITVAARNFVLDTTTGSKWGTATSQKQSFWNATPIIQPTTAIAASTFVANTSGTLNDTATWDGYTHGQVVKALRNIGILA